MYKYKINIVKYIVVALLVALSTKGSTMAQNGINSPYSQYGIGQTNLPYNVPAFSALGGVVITRTSTNTINPFNPASYACIGKETFVFDMGLSIEMSTLRNNSNSLYDADGNLGYLSMGFPLTKWWKVAMGVMPLTDISYESVQSADVTDVAAGLSEGYTARTIYEGTGGVAQFFVGSGFTLHDGQDGKRPELRAGFNINYLNGSLTRAITYDFPGNDSTYMMDSRKQKDTYLSNLLIDMGLQLDVPLGSEYQLGLGLTCKLPRKMQVKDDAMIYTFVTSGAVEYIRDTIFPESGMSSEYESDLEQGLGIGLGVSMQRFNHWLVALDGSWAPWSGLKYTEDQSHNLFGVSPLRYDDNYNMSFGLQRLGDKNSSRYMRRITLSGGFHYEVGKLRLSLNGTDHVLNEWGLGAGMALPMRKGRSVLNLSVSYSSFGTTDLLRRNMVSFGISIGSCESWFVKRKYN